ncbi:MAG: flagellar biosynthesis protein [Clostridiaceae bacterium]|jgi:flagellar operon protein|nr:flagellar biosynthesis protein [Clostridiaceae bacterium]
MIYGKRPITGPIAPQTPAKVHKRQDLHKADGFAEILKDKLNEGRDITISKHARLRMEMRNVNLTEAQRKKLANAVDKADAKGVRDTLVVMDKMAFVVNVRNRTLITAVNSGELKENVFTNIDGAVFAD